MTEAPPVTESSFREVLERVRGVFGQEAARGFFDGYHDKPSGNARDFGYWVQHREGANLRRLERERA